MANTTSNFELLRAKSILTILDGDTKFGEIQISPTKTVNNALPYLTGPMLCDISNKLVCLSIIVGMVVHRAGGYILTTSSHTVFATIGHLIC